MKPFQANNWHVQVETEVETGIGGRNTLNFVGNRKPGVAGTAYGLLSTKNINEYCLVRILLVMIQH